MHTPCILTGGRYILKFSNKMTRMPHAGNKGLNERGEFLLVDCFVLLVNIHFEDNEALSIASFINPRNVAKYTYTLRISKFIFS